MRVALGFRPHSTWTVVVAVGPAGTAFVERGRIELGDPSVPEQVYHAARGLDIDAAAELVRHAERVIGDAAAAAVRDLVADLKVRGHTVGAAGVPTSSARVPQSLERILASHPLLHAAEGELIRTALTDAAGDAGLAVYQAQARDLAAHARTALGHGGAALDRMLNDLGRAVGPPWRRDEKDATLAAWLALRSAEGASATGPPG